MPVPFADLQLQYQTIKSEIDGAIASVIRDNAFIRGSYVDAFEREFAAAVEVRHCVSCANGTDALYLAMAALKVKPGDEVITTAHSWISTSAMITHAGATVVFCDTDGATFTIDPTAIEAAITPRTVGIIPVHLYGQPADMDAIMAIANKHNLWVVEDCAQAHLARYKGQQVGTFGAAATYSFYPGKNLGAMGDAGAVVTNDDALAEHMTMLARHGGLVKHQHHIEGINSRLDGMQAAILSAKLPHLGRTPRKSTMQASTRSRMSRCRTSCPTAVTSIISTPSGIRAATRWRRTSTPAACRRRSIIPPRCRSLPPMRASAIVPSNFPMHPAIRGKSCRCRCSRRSPASSRTR
jgi:dTDP-4-amino-4,6-dideoxygalactose transaminase